MPYTLLDIAQHCASFTVIPRDERAGRADLVPSAGWDAGLSWNPRLGILGYSPCTHDAQAEDRSVTISCAEGLVTVGMT